MGKEHYRKELGDMTLGAEHKADAAGRLARMASALLGRELSQLLAADKRMLSIDLIGACGRFGVPLPFPHAPLFLEAKEAGRVERIG